jgi:ABC-type nitrate/sulfonate/bicarbonate transport system substrate-binding protein
MADMALKHFGLEPGRDVAVVPLRGNRVAALETGAVKAALLGVPENIIAVDKDITSFFFWATSSIFPRTASAPR